MIVTGHGSFATGLTSGLKLLAGEPDYYEAVDFEPEASVEELTQRLEQALWRLRDCGEIAVFADLTGGSPFNVSVRLKLSQPARSMEVAGNANLPAVIQAYLSRAVYSDAASLMDESLAAGKEGMARFIPGDRSGEEDTEIEIENTEIENTEIEDTEIEDTEIA